MKDETISKLKKYGRVKEPVIHPEPKIHAGHMELAVANMIGYRMHVIVPNVSWGLGLRHEADMLVLDQKNRFTEIEIKISKSDFLADFKKGHGHVSNIISRLVYAVPESMSDYCLQYLKENIDSEHVGLISVSWVAADNRFCAKWVKQAVHDKTKEQPDAYQISRFKELGCMRIWSLKQHNNKRHD